MIERVSAERGLSVEPELHLLTEDEVLSIRLCAPPRPADDAPLQFAPQRGCERGDGEAGGMALPSTV